MSLMHAETSDQQLNTSDMSSYFRLFLARAFLLTTSSELCQEDASTCRNISSGQRKFSHLAKIER